MEHVTSTYQPLLELHVNSGQGEDESIGKISDEEKERAQSETGRLDQPHLLRYTREKKKRWYHD